MARNMPLSTPLFKSNQAAAISFGRYLEQA